MRRDNKTFRSKFLIIILYYIILHYSFLKIKEDKGFQKDMQILIVECIACEWSGKLKDYQVFNKILYYYIL